jgi:hypothetical protein
VEKALNLKIREFENSKMRKSQEHKVSQKSLIWKYENVKVWNAKPGSIPYLMW